jgi:hypothetical protein
MAELELETSSNSNPAGVSKQCHSIGRTTANHGRSLGKAAGGVFVAGTGDLPIR